MKRVSWRLYDLVPVKAVTLGAPAAAMERGGAVMMENEGWRRERERARRREGGREGRREGGREGERGRRGRVERERDCTQQISANTSYSVTS